MYGLYTETVHFEKITFPSKLEHEFHSSMYFFVILDGVQREK